MSWSLAVRKGLERDERDGCMKWEGRGGGGGVWVKRMEVACDGRRSRNE